MNISILNWLGFEFVEFRCEAEPGGSATAQAEDVFAQCRRGLGQFGLGFNDNVRSRIWAVDRDSWQVASNARFWDLTAPHLREYHLVAVDQRGHGLSSKPDDGYDFSSFSADVAAVIEALGLRRPVVVGHSWGPRRANSPAFSPSSAATRCSRSAWTMKSQRCGA